MYDKYYNYLIEENKKFNLTSITNKDEVFIKHFYDSKVLINYLDLKNKSILDIGSGAGFPGVVLKIEEPSINLSLIDSVSKKTIFLNNLKNELNLEYNVINDRIENLDKNNKFDIIVSRAVARLNILLELAIPYVKVNGYFVAYKGNNALKEVEEIKNGLIKLNSEIEKIVDFDLPNNYGKRYLIIIKKLKETNDIYPRIYSKIKKNPL